MAVPSSEYFDNEGGNGISSEAFGIIIASLALVILMSKVVSEVKQGSNINHRPNTEIRNNVDTFLRTTDTIGIKTR